MSQISNEQGVLTPFSKLTMKYTAHIRTDPKVALGIKKKYGVKKLSAKIVNVPEKIPANGVFIPLASLTAERENAPQVGMDWKNDPKMLQIPRAIISCEASTTFPVAFSKINNKKLNYVHGD